MDFERITTDPARMLGLPCIRDTGVMVSTILGQLAAARSTAQILADYPELEREDVLTVLECATAIALGRDPAIHDGVPGRSPHAALGLDPGEG